MNPQTLPKAPIATYTLLGLNIALFGLMVQQGIHPMNPNPDELIRWGANFGPITLTGQWWRLLSCMFLHAGVLHIACNGYAFYCLGPAVERSIGRPFFLIVYMASGTIGSLASLWWHPMAVSVGASGALFGIFGAFISFVFIYRRWMPEQALAALRKNVIVILIINVALGLNVKSIDMAAHLGGFLGGAVSGAILCPPPKVLTKRTKPLRMGIVIIGTLLLCVGVMTTLSHAMVSLNTLMEDYSQAEEHVETASRLVDPNSLSTADYAARFEEHVLLPWQQAKEQLDNTAIAKLPPSLQPLLDKLRQQIQSRDELLNTLHTYLREQDTQKRAAYKQQLENIRKQLDSISF